MVEKMIENNSEVKNLDVHDWLFKKVGYPAKKKSDKADDGIINQK